MYKVSKNVKCKHIVCKYVSSISVVIIIIVVVKATTNVLNSDFVAHVEHEVCFMVEKMQLLNR